MKCQICGERVGSLNLLTEEAANIVRADEICDDCLAAALKDDPELAACPLVWRTG